MEQSIYWAAFASISGVTLERMEELEAHFGDMSNAWHARTRELLAAGLRNGLARKIRTRSKELDIDAMAEELDAHGVDVIHARSERYPSLLLETFDPPPALYIKGELKPQDGEGIAVVGTRRSTRYGDRMCDRIASGIAMAGITVVSGLARGIDTAAHRAAVDNGGRTVAVLGGGIGNIYPSENQGLAEEIADNGCLVSEYPLFARPSKANFPMRNRIIVGLSRGIVVVEAPNRSGIQRTVKWALDWNREVFAVPGEIKSEMSLGSNRLLKEGANVATCSADVIAALRLHYPNAEAKLEAANLTATVVEPEPARPRRTSRRSRAPKPNGDSAPANAPAVDESALAGLDGDESVVSRFLASSGSAHCVDEIARGSELPAHTVANVLTMLQVKRIVTCLEGTMYSLVGGASRRLQHA